MSHRKTDLGIPCREKSAKVVLGLVVLSLAMLSGCVLAPEGIVEEQARLNSQSTAFEPRFDARQLPVLPTPAHWRDVLRRAFLANGELESAYFE